ncbi:SigE family RNA polymerase sigma factor [Streptomyces sp. PLK6-54]|uniref:SigE family RNA polymerase sigma factor n=1 Tax=Actinacidiphila acidipaludis TaxID=2873382 RepID=A0ABS7Q6W4_9ACTN|nr:SigE family RNA polymerase sigma factor [Streptomyces acidipaludis]
MDFGEFVALRSGALFRTAFLLTGSREVAEDLVQESLEKAYRRWQRVCATDSPEAYLRRMVVNAANDRWRRQRRIGERIEFVDQAASGDPYALIDLREDLVRALQLLPIGMRTVVVLRYLHDMDDRQVAEMLGVSPGTVQSQLCRALAKLRTAQESPSPPKDRRGAQPSASFHS